MPGNYSYAANTDVSADRSQAEIEHLLVQWGANIIFHPYGCWEWTGSISDQGYGRAGSEYAHRLFYRTFRGEIPDELVLDHRCHTTLCPGGPTCPHRRCVNPGHTIPDTRGENVLRGSNLKILAHHNNTCVAQHEMTPENTYVSPKGQVQCRECRKRRERDRGPRPKASRRPSAIEE